MGDLPGKFSELLYVKQNKTQRRLYHLPLLHINRHTHTRTHTRVHTHMMSKQTKSFGNDKLLPSPMYLLILKAFTYQHIIVTKSITVSIHFSALPLVS